MKVAIYVRVSTQEQEISGYSIPAQISTLKQYCAYNNYIVHNIYQDLGISGKNIKDRPGLKKLIQDSKEQNFDSVLVWKLSRLSRNLLDLLQIVKDLEEHKVSFQSFSEKFDTSTPIGKMLLHMLGSVAEFERNTIIENVKMGMNERFRQGYSKGAIPFGYIHKDKKAIVDKEKSEIVKYIFEAYNASESDCLNDLTNYINNAGYRTRQGGLFTRISVRSMLRNHFYAGYVRTGYHSRGNKLKNNAEVIKGSHEAIISKDLFDNVQAKLDSKKKVIRSSDDSGSLFSGLVKCPLCGCKMFGLNTYNKYKKKDGTINKYTIEMYRCGAREKSTVHCEGFYIASNKIDPFCIDILRKMSKSKRLFNALNKPKFQFEEDNSINILENELKSFKKLRDKYFKLFENDNINPEMFTEKINEILKNIEVAENKLQKNKEKNKQFIPQENLFDAIKTFNQIINDLDNKEKKQFLHQIVKEIKISKDKELESLIFANDFELIF